MTHATSFKSRSDTEERILNAARDLFYSEGFAGTTTEKLARAASVSKSSIYRYFGDMVGLFSAVIKAEGDMYKLDAPAPATSQAEFWDSLQTYGTNLLNLLNKPFCIRLDQMLHENAHDHPDLARAFYDTAYGSTLNVITDMIGHGQEQGFVQSTLPAADLANNLVSMWEGFNYVQTRLGLLDKPFKDPAGWSKQCIDTLFHRQF